MAPRTMGQHPHVIELTARQRRELQNALRRGLPGEALRAVVVLWSAQGQSARRIAQALGVTPRTVHNCRRRWRQFGLKGLAPAAHPGRPPRVTAAYLQLLMKTAEKDPRNLGF